MVLCFASLLVGISSDINTLHFLQEYVPAPTSEWCNCGKCHGWPEPAMNVCCQQHQIWQTKDYGGPVEVECICDCDVIQDLLKPGPLRMMYHNYRSYHGMLIWK